MISGPTQKKNLISLFESQKLGVLATQHKKTPHTSLVAFACSEDMHHIVFATPKATRKYANLLSNSCASFFVDNRSNKTSDFKKAVGVTVSGSVRPIHKNKNSKLMKAYLDKHPNLQPFLVSRACALMCLDINTIYVVEQFQNVTEIHLT
ncbi:MAG: pyridoxamine 5'-phosphate oxidase family protein [Planctomycetes bacterium]|nr:pyridoxamine 5'-phosphate oxidase family protein [Planctomycetota bacterium]